MFRLNSRECRLLNDNDMPLLGIYFCQSIIYFMNILFNTDMFQSRLKFENEQFYLRKPLFVQRMLFIVMPPLKNGGITIYNSFSC